MKPMPQDFPEKMVKPIDKMLATLAVITMI
jgi:hypothetical protein